MPLVNGLRSNDTGFEYLQNESGIFLPADIVREQYKKKPTCVDLFCGAGGFSLGMIKAGFEVICGVENDFYATLTYLYNLGQYPMRMHFVTQQDEEEFEKKLRKEEGWKEDWSPTKKGKGKEQISIPTVCGGNAGASFRMEGSFSPVRSFIYGDATKVTGELIRKVAGLAPDEEVSCVVGGPPCQGYSVAGKQDVHDPRNSMVFEMARIIWELKPETFVFENVPNIQNMQTPEGLPVVETFMMIAKHGMSYFEAIKELAAQGHHVGAKTSVSKDKTRPRRGKKGDDETEDELAEQQSLFGTT